MPAREFANELVVFERCVEIRQVAGVLRSMHMVRVRQRRLQLEPGAPAAVESCSPLTISTGMWICASGESSMAFAALAAAAREIVARVTRQYRAPAARASRASAVIRRVSGCALHSVRNASQAVARARSRGTRPSAGRVAPSARERRRAVEHQAARDAGMACGEFEHHARALRHADQQRASYPELASSVRRSSTSSAQRRAARRQAEAAPVVAHDAQCRGERRLRLPHVEVERPAMHEHHGGSGAFVAITQTGAGHCQVAVRGVHGISNTEKDFAIRLRARTAQRQAAAPNGESVQICALSAMPGTRASSTEISLAGLAQHRQALPHQRGLRERGANGWSC